MVNESYSNNLLGAFATAVASSIETRVSKVGNLGINEAATLVAVSNHPGDTIDVLSRVLNLTHSGTVRLVNRLESEGLIERRKSLKDARAVTVHVTAKGAEIVAEVLETRAAVVEKVLSSLSPDQKELLTPVLEKALSALTEDMPSARRICRLCHEGVCRPQGCPVEKAVVAGE
ncbi:MarR family winged helix-turn-helix transcriptional regulator [Kiloniella sp. b19]|uniref:MarR family winged helix-turn-helix transcriptional regulator n=1 Tax=Kiloniella sp. GXU_MW_B19 TaxID=3141326 RepID=UPI0031E12020